MDMSEWAKREIELACKRNRGNRLKEEFDDEFNYGCACYASALKAFKSMLDDAHSGTSIMITKYILNRLKEEYNERKRMEECRHGAVEGREV